MPRTHTIYLTRDLDGTLSLHTALPRRDKAGFWSCPDGRTEPYDELTLLGQLLRPQLLSLKWLHPIAVNISVSLSYLNELIRETPPQPC